MNIIAKKSRMLTTFAVFINLMTYSTLIAQPPSQPKLEDLSTNYKIIQMNDQGEIIIGDNAKKYISGYENKFTKNSNGEESTQTTLTLTPQGEDLLKNNPKQFEALISGALSDFNSLGFYPNKGDIQALIKNNQNQELGTFKYKPKDDLSGEKIEWNSSKLHIGRDALTNQNPNTTPTPKENTQGINIK